MKIAVLFILSAIGFGRSFGQTYTETPARAYDYVDGVGVCTHLRFTNVYYTAFDNIIYPKLKELGIRHIRDGVPYKDFMNARDTLLIKNRFIKLYDSLGIKVCYCLGSKITIDNLRLRDSAAYLSVFQSSPALRRTIQYLEGFNEPDLTIYGWYPANWDTLTYAVQKGLWNKAHSMPELSGIPVVSTSLVSFWSQPSRPNKVAAMLPPISSYFDLANFHTYDGDSVSRKLFPGYYYDATTSFMDTVRHGKPFVITETGYENARYWNLPDSPGYNPNSYHYLSELAAGKYYSVLFMEMLKRGAKKVYAYEFIDERTSNQSNNEMNFGLIHTDGTAKPAFAVIKNTLGILNDSGTSFTPSPLTFTLSGDVAGINHALYQKANGHYYLALWQGITKGLCYDAPNYADLPADSQSVKIVLPFVSSRVKVYQPLVSAAPVYMYSDKDTLQVQVPDHLLLVEIAPADNDPLAPYINRPFEKATRISEEKDAGITIEKLSFSSRQARNTVYGMIASPTLQGKYPAVLIFHGGSSCADEVQGFVRRYARQGYVAMAIDLPGICDPAKARFSDGPWKARPGKRDLRFDIAQSIDSSTLVDAMAAALQAYNFLGGRDNVDKERMGITGFSWGGYMTTMLAGLLGNRVKAAYAVFGCGFYERGSNWKDTLAAMSPMLRTRWLTCFDAGRRAPGIRCPYFIEASSNDKFFWPPAVMATMDTVMSIKNLVWGPNLDHTRLAGGDEMQQLYFDHYLKGLGKPFGQVRISHRLRQADGSMVIGAQVTMPAGVSTDSVLLYYAEKNVQWSAKKWTAIQVPLVSGNTYSVTLPPEIVTRDVDYFIQVIDARKVRLSSYMQDDLLPALRLPSLVGDNMVLQRDIRLPIWGWADPGAAIEIVFNGKTYRTATGKEGKWMLSLDKQKAGGPYVMHISDKKTSLTIKNILIGEVWLCSGQSNMAYGFNEPPAKKYYEKEIAGSTNDQIRQLLVSRTTSLVPEDNFKSAGWLAAEPANLPAFSVAAYFFAKDLFEKYHVPVGLINASYGGTSAEGWTSEEALKPFPQPTTYRPQDHPSALFNAMIAPLTPYAIRGVIWYQGENNAWNAYEYRNTFPNMIKDWRTRWGQKELPFIFQQLVNWRAAVDQPSESDWAELREAQAMTLSVSQHTGMAVGIDMGEGGDLHPVDKKGIGHRLFLAALPVAYGEGRAGNDGPFYRSMKVAGSRVTLDLDTRGSRLVARGGGQLRYFAIAGPDKKFVWANAVITNKHTIEVWSDQVSSPVAVRYAWANNPEGCNLYNAAGLPASPFRTDDWPGITSRSKGDFLKRQFPASDGDTLRYRILYPENYDIHRHYPLVLFLHGSGERGADNERQLQVGGIGNLFRKEENRKAFPCIALFPQCPAAQYWATVDINSNTTPFSFHFNYQKEMTPVMRSVMELTRTIIREDAVDTNRIYVMGTSMGGIATYEAVYRFPELFAAAVPVCGAGDSSAYTARTAKVPFLLFHGDADPVVGVKESRGMYQRLMELGGDVQLTVYPGVGHTSWRNAFAEPDLLGRLFAKRRGRKRYSSPVGSLVR